MRISNSTLQEGAVVGGSLASCLGPGCATGCPCAGGPSRMVRGAVEIR